VIAGSPQRKETPIKIPRKRHKIPDNPRKQDEKNKISRKTIRT
jgi:hypothetical protein